MIAKETNKALDFINDKKYGLQIDKAKGYMYSIFVPYCAYISLKLIIWSNYIFDLSPTISLIICLGIASIMFFSYDNLLTKYIYSEDRYLYYFKIFEKEDKRWYRKWKWITIAFGSGGCIILFTWALLGYYFSL